MKIGAGPRRRTPDRSASLLHYVRILGLAACALGCEGREAESLKAPLQAQASQDLDEAQAKPSVAAKPPAAAKRGPKLQGRAAQAPGANLAAVSDAEQRLVVDRPLSLGSDASASLHYDVGASVRVTGPALVAVAEGRESGLLVHQGTLVVDLERAALHPESGFWVATRALRIELVQGARVALRSLGDGASRLVVVSGRAAVWSVAGPDAPRVLQSGETLHVDAEGRVSDGERIARPHLEAVQASLIALPEPATERALAPRIAAQQLALSVACERVETIRAQNQALLSEHQALRKRDDPAAMAVQERLAQQGARAFRDRQALVLSLSFFEAETLHAPLEGTQRELIARARTLLR